MEEDILNHLPTVMFRGTPCILSGTNFFRVIKLVQTFEWRVETLD